MAGMIVINISYEGDDEVSEIYKLHRQTRWVDLEAMVRYCVLKNHDLVRKKHVRKVIYS
jgi:hypothetical protein